MRRAARNRHEAERAEAQTAANDEAWRRYQEEKASQREVHATAKAQHQAQLWAEVEANLEPCRQGVDAACFVISPGRLTQLPEDQRRTANEAYVAGEALIKARNEKALDERLKKLKLGGTP